MEKPRADFHVHIGDRTNEDFIQEALDNNVKVVAALDRGSEVKIDRLKDLITYGEKRGVTVIPGVESFTQVTLCGQQAAFELIGLDFDLDHPDIYRIFDPRAGIPPQLHDPKISFQRTILENMGFNLDPSSENQLLYDEIKSRMKAETAIRYCQITLMNPQNLQLMNSPYWQKQTRIHFQSRPEDQGHLENVLYWSVFAPGKEGYWQNHLSFKLILDTIHKAGGVVIGAHPKLKLGDEGPNLDSLIEFWFDQGIDGLEVWDAAPPDTYLTHKAVSRHKLYLGGSGRDIKYSNRIMGRGDAKLQDMYIHPKMLDMLRNYKERVKLIYGAEN